MARKNVKLVILFLSLAAVIRSDDEVEGEVEGEVCSVTLPNFSTLDNRFTAEEEVEAGTEYRVFCASEFQLGSSSVADIPCVTDQIPKSCRKVEILTPSEEYATGSEVKLTCRITSDDMVTGVRWIKDDADFRDQGDFQSGQSSPYQSILTFTSTTDDSGTYKCEATMDSLAPFDKEISTVDAAIFILAAEISPDDETIYLQIGETLPLSCSFRNLASYSLAIIWLRDADEIKSMYNTDEEGDIVSRTNIVAASDPAYSNIYTCKGVYNNIDTNNEIEVSSFRRVEIRGFTIQPTSLNLGIGDDASFTCETVGEVQGTFQWLLDSTPQSSSLFSIAHDPVTRATKSVLDLQSVQKQNSGVVCRVTYGDLILESELVRLNVYSIEFVTTPKDRAFKEGETYEMTCSVKTEPGIVPTISWYKDQESVSGEKYSETVSDDKTVYESRLYFPSASTNNDNGEYFCRIDFKLNSISTSMSSDPVSVYVRNVRFFPDVQYHKSDSAADSKQFYCFYIGDAEPGIGVESVSWWVNDVDITGVDNFSIDNARFTSSGNWKSLLVMSNMSPRLAGSIECRYQCGIGGYISGEGLLYVHRAISLPAETLTASHTYTITCTTETNEPATVVWSKNNKQIFINDANFEPQPRVTENYVQTNTLVVKDWSTSNEETSITCKHVYEKTKSEQSSSTNFIFKGFTGSPKQYNYYSPSVKVMYCSFGFTYTRPVPTEAQWLKDGQDLAGNQRFEEKINTQTGNWEVSLHIVGDGQGGTIEDSGAYTCKFVFSADEEYEKTANVYFYTLTTLPGESQFYDASSLSLSCVLASRNLAVSGVEWKKGGTQLTEPAFTGELAGSTATLTISQVIPENSGGYTCVLTVPDYQIDTVKSIEIRNIDMLVEEFITLKKGDSITLSCSVRYFSTDDQISWYKDGILVSSGVSHSRSPPTLTGKLRISNVQTENLGEYQCGIGDSRSTATTTLSASEITTEDDITLKGGTVTVGCTVSKITSQPTLVYWTDDAGTEYKATDTSEVYSVTNYLYNTVDKEQRSTLQISDVEVDKEFTCFFIVDGHTNKRKAKVTVLDIETTPSLTYKGSDAEVQCRIVNLPSTSSEVTCSWTSRNEKDNTVTQLGSDKSTSLLDGTMTSSVELSGVQSNVMITCTFALSGEDFSKDVQVEIYEVTAPPDHLLQRGSPLSLQLQVQPEMADTSSAIKDLSITDDSSVNGDAQISGLTVSYTALIGPMVITYTFLDTSGESRSLTTTVYVAELGQPQVGLSDGIAAATLTCTMSGSLTDDIKSEMSAFWVVGGAKTFHTPTITGNVISSEHIVQVSSETTDVDIPCGFTYETTEFSHIAKLDIIDIEFEDEVQLEKDGKQTLECTVSGSSFIEPIRAVWYKGNTQMLIQDLTESGWPSALTTSLPDVTEAGTYRCVIDFGVAEFSYTISVSLDDTVNPVDPVDPIQPVDPNEPDKKSSKDVAIAIGISVPVILLCVVLIVFFLCYVKKRKSARTSYNVKSLTPHATAYNHPASLVYHNDVSRHDPPPQLTLNSDTGNRAGSRASNYVTTPRNHDKQGKSGGAEYNNPSFNYPPSYPSGRQNSPPPRPLQPVSKRPAPLPPTTRRLSDDGPPDSPTRPESPTRPSRPARPTIEVRPTRPDRPPGVKPDRPDRTYDSHEPVVTLNKDFNAANYSTNMVPKPPGKAKIILDSIQTTDA